MSFFFITVLVASAAGGNTQYLLNGDFEAGKNKDLPGWDRSFYPERDGIGNCVYRSDERARSGRWSLKIDTGSVLGEDTTLVFNGSVSEEAMKLRGRRLVLSGWVYVEPGTALRPIGMRLRTFGRDREGRNTFLGDVLEVKVLGRPGRWAPFRASGFVPNADITGMDLHCGIRPDTVRAVQFLDNLRLEGVPLPPLEIRLPRDAIWRDEAVLPVEVLSATGKGADTIDFYLMTGRGKVKVRWSRPLRTGMMGLPLPKAYLAEGGYLLQARLTHRKRCILAAATAALEISTSPWEDARRLRHPPAARRLSGKGPEGFEAMGTAAPATLPDTLPEQAEISDPDMKSPLWQRQGYVVFSRHYLDPVSRLGRPKPGEIGAVRLFGCPGEYEPATVSVWAIRPQAGVRVTVSDLAGKEGIVPANKVDIRVVRTIRGLPSFLERRPAVNIPEGQTQTFWLSFYIPPEARPGFYFGSIEVAPGNGKSFRVPVALRVLPLKLPPPQKGYGFWWKMDGRWNGYYSKDHVSALAQIRKQFILLREHGCNMASCYGMPRMAKAGDGTITLDFNQDHWGHDKFSITDFLQLGRETGFLSPKIPIQYPGAESLHTDWIARDMGLDHSSKAFSDFYRDMCRRMDRWAKQQGFTLAFACVDEIGNSEDRRQEALRFYAKAKEAGVLTSVTDNSMHGGVHLMGQPRFDDIVRMRLYNFITPEMIESTRKSGDILWLYNLASGGWNAKTDRFAFGLFTERCGATGFAQWAFQWPNGSTDPYEAAAAGQGSGYHYALPAPDGPLPTLALEGVREGIDDARYLALLRQRHLKSPAAFLNDIEPLSTAMPEYLEKHGGSFFDVRRWQIAREAMRGRRP